MIKCSATAGLSLKLGIEWVNLGSRLQRRKSSQLITTETCQSTFRKFYSDIYQNRSNWKQKIECFWTWNAISKLPMHFHMSVLTLVCRGKSQVYANNNLPELWRHKLTLRMLHNSARVSRWLTCIMSGRRASYRCVHRLSRLRLKLQSTTHFEFERYLCHW